jgi:restriction system protein
MKMVGPGLFNYAFWLVFVAILAGSISEHASTHLPFSRANALEAAGKGTSRSRVDESGAARSIAKPLHSRGWTIPSFGEAFGLTLLGAAISVAVYRMARVIRRANALRTGLQKARNTVERQIGSLTRRRAQLVRPDAYGKPRIEKWKKEVDYFVTHHIEPSLTPIERSVLGRECAMIRNFIEARVEDETQARSASASFHDKMTPAEFELFCADELRQSGWDARVTMQSRDQGVDVVAERDGLRVVIQCKLYARPVGNKSVQEAAAARAHEQAGHAVVVTNNGYTGAAEQLAATNGVLLLHYSDLRNLDEILGGKERIPPRR